MNWLAYIPVCSLLPDTLPPPTVSCLGEIVVLPFWKDLKYLYLTSSFCSFSLISFLYSIFNEHKPNSSICPLPIGSGLPLAPFPLSPAFVGMRFSEFAVPHGTHFPRSLGPGLPGGRSGWTRTIDLGNNACVVSYPGARFCVPARIPDVSYPLLVGLDGLEPSTSRLSGARSNHLSYRPFLIWFSSFVPSR